MPWWLPYANFFGQLPICQLDHFDLLWWIR